MTAARIIVVMGVTGVGKSTFIQYATGEAVKVGDGMEACTAKVTMYQIPGTNVYLMDTPGFDDTYLSDADVLKTIAKTLVEAFEDQYEIHGALYIHAITEPKMRGSGMTNLIMFKKVLGPKGMVHCRLVTTKWSIQPKGVSIARERELREKKDFWQPLLVAGAQTVRFGDSTESARDIIKPLVEGLSFEPLLVEEIAREHKAVDETQAGGQVLDNIEKAKEKHAAEIRELRDYYDTEAESMRDELIASHQAAVKKLEDDKRALREHLSAKGSGRAGRWIARGGAWAAGTLMTGLSGGLLAPAAAGLIAATELGAQAHKRL